VSEQSSADALADALRVLVYAPDPRRVGESSLSTPLGSEDSASLRASLAVSADLHRGAFGGEIVLASVPARQDADKARENR